VARNRKRANQRRLRRPTDSREGLPTATESSSFDNGHEHEIDENGAPDPIEHAAPDAEIADAQLAYARPEEPEPGDDADEEEFELEVEDSIQSSGGGGGRRGRRGGSNGGGDADDGYDGGASAGAVAIPARGHVEARENPITRLIGFLQGSWRELQRVQWPDRRQVMQATGVVIGFVIVAAAFLGASDWVAGKLVTFILK